MLSNDLLPTDSIDDTRIAPGATLWVFPIPQVGLSVKYIQLDRLINFGDFTAYRDKKQKFLVAN